MCDMMALWPNHRPSISPLYLLSSLLLPYSALPHIHKVAMQTPASISSFQGGRNEKTRSTAEKPLTLLKEHSREAIDPFNRRPIQ